MTERHTIKTKYMEARNFIVLKFDDLKIKSKVNILSNSSLKSVCGNFFFAIFALKN